MAPAKCNPTQNENVVEIVNHPMHRFRVIEHEDSQNGHQGFDIVFNNSGSVMRDEGQ